MDIVLDKFRKALEEQGMVIERIDEDGLIYVSKGEVTLQVNLENLRRDYARDGDDGVVHAFVKGLAAYGAELPEDWEEARGYIFFSFLPSGEEYQNVIESPVTDTFIKVVSFYDGTTFKFITHHDIHGWRISVEELLIQAEQNGDGVAERASIEFEDIEGRRLGYIQTDIGSLKVTILFSAAMRARLGEELGWPFYAVVPVRDFCYVFSEADLAFFSGRLGSTVMKEYTQSGWPITTEVLRFTEEGIEAIGRYGE